jgi:hypothetical protein
MAKYLLESVNVAHRNGIKAVIVEADSSAIAKEVAGAMFDADDDWAGSTATDLATAFATTLVGYTYRITIGPKPAQSPAQYANLLTVEHVATAQTADQIGDALVILLNATEPIAGAAYNSSTNVLTIAETTDELGDRTIKVDILPPGGALSVNSLRSSLTHQGAEGAALKCTLVQPTAMPRVGKSI